MTEQEKKEIEEIIDNYLRACGIVSGLLAPIKINTLSSAIAAYIDKRDEERLGELKYSLEEMCYQFGDQIVLDGVPYLGTGGLSALKNAFRILGWPDLKPCLENACELCGKEWATCGTPAPKSKYDPKTGMTTSYTKNYYRCCGKCYTKLSAT